ncbi:nucleotidyltransferase [Sporosarcina sp. PTS2304]|uniref:nucleotidyltransferase n=1 Tax=Sporosarcina sp. PTS2304 TaxID=2283194 RepID=UPI000E0CD40D|nr:nucleotidyltransferase [Sporosarcina sp. PTS2304]AXH98609.1 nucleotidyltransferase [Sporosarcina sp. PTS2304]
MIATGIVVEYNPFHNGHLYHLQQAKMQTNATVIIAVMSGQFLQRGEPAIVDKWTRARMALANGADLVIELPYAFATAHAPQFAKGAIELLDALHCNYFCFGSEEGSIAPFTNSLELMDTYSTIYERTIQDAMAEGLSYPKALQAGYEMIARKADVSLADLSEPNNILGFHYMQVARNIQSSMIPVTISRRGSHYHDDILPKDTIASATSIRAKLMHSHQLQDVENFMPPSSFHLLQDWTARHGFQSWERLYPFLRYTILREEPPRLAEIADVTEGIEFTLCKAAKEQASFQDFMHAVKSKRYTWTRIQRMLVHILTGYQKSTRKQITSPSYIRLLGMSEMGRTYLRTIKKDLALPVVSRVASLSDISLDLDSKSTDIYMCGIQSAPPPGLDYRMPPIML